MASEKGCQQPQDVKYWPLEEQGDVKNFLSQANIQTNNSSLLYLLSQKDSLIAEVGWKVIEGQRISASDALILYESRDLGLLGALSCFVKRQKTGNEVYYNRNFHIEPTNTCVHRCRFCSYSCYYKEVGAGFTPAQSESKKEKWEYTINDIVEISKRFQHSGFTEVHITGGVHPDRDVYFYEQMLQAIRVVLPEIHIKAFNAAE